MLLNAAIVEIARTGSGLSLRVAPVKTIGMRLLWAPETDIRRSEPCEIVTMPEKTYSPIPTISRLRRLPLAGDLFPVYPRFRFKYQNPWTAFCSLRRRFVS